MLASLALGQGFSAFPANFLKRPSRKCLDFVDSGGSFPPDTRDGRGHMLIQFCWKRTGEGSAGLTQALVRGLCSRSALCLPLTIVPYSKLSIMCN